MHFSVWSWLPLHLSAFSMGPHERFLVFVPKPQVSLQEDHSDQGGTMRNKYGSEEVDDHSISESCFMGDILKKACKALISPLPYYMYVQLLVFYYL